MSGVGNRMPAVNTMRAALKEQTDNKLELCSSSKPKLSGFMDPFGVYFIYVIHILRSKTLNGLLSLGGFSVAITKCCFIVFIGNLGIYIICPANTRRVGKCL